MNKNINLLHRLSNFDQQSEGVGAHFNWVMDAILDIYEGVTCILISGSQANGNSDKYSDYDIYAICNSINFEKHEMRKVHQRNMDVHLISLDMLLLRLRHEEKSRFCFYVKSCSESLCIYGDDIGKKIINYARKIYITQNTFDNWLKIKINLDSIINDRHKLRCKFGDYIYVSELSMHLLRILSLHNFGWASRSDVMIEWLQQGVSGSMDKLSSAQGAAINGDYSQMLSLSQYVSSKIPEMNVSLSNFSISQNGIIDVIQ